MLAFFEQHNAHIFPEVISIVYETLYRNATRYWRNWTNLLSGCTLHNFLPLKKEHSC